MIRRVIGNVKLEKGEQSMRSNLKQNPSIAVMDVRQIVLRPVAK